ncbi:MAG: ImmA/IrrE family metallo-endopeptidase [Candidatus Nealsonbacteria bacterium]
MDYKNVIVPYLDNEKIKEEADWFRKKFWNNKVPVDIESIIDIKLKINIIPILGFSKLTSTDTLITSDWKSIYVDKYQYLNQHDRLKFSLAHEVGHFVLHKRIYNTFKIKNLTDYYKFNENIPQRQYSYLETQANKFASYLLVPRDVLITERKKELKKRKNPDWFKKINTKTLNSYLAIPLSKVFKVSDGVVAIALNDLDGI